jgi:phosphoenolpyruvate carboxykinase (GTP)
VYAVNWFRTGADGRFLWPGFGDNLRVLAWIADRCRGEGDAVHTPIGRLPGKDALNVAGASISADTLGHLLTVDADSWRAALNEQADYLRGYGPRVPEALWEELNAMRRALSRSPE